MNSYLFTSALELINKRHFAEALPLLRQVISQDQSNWNAWELAGQCSRYLNDIKGAITYLSQAAKLKSDERSIFLALGIAFQLDERWEDSIDALHRAIEIDPNYVLAYNSLALTHQKCGELEKALLYFDQSLKCLAHQIVLSMKNSPTSPTIKTRDTTESLWIEYAAYAAGHLSNSAEVDAIAWPNSEQAMEEERTERHGGLYWVDGLNENKENLRLFLPNYFSMFLGQLKSDKLYATLIGNRGIVLELLGRNDDAQKHFNEANELLS